MNLRFEYIKLHYFLRWIHLWWLQLHQWSILTVFEKCQKIVVLTPQLPSTMCIIDARFTTMCSATAERKSTILVTFSAYHRQHHGARWPSCVWRSEFRRGKRQQMYFEPDARCPLLCLNHFCNPSQQTYLDQNKRYESIGKDRKERLFQNRKWRSLAFCLGRSAKTAPQGF